jgi:hypothetical protein
MRFLWAFRSNPSRAHQRLTVAVKAERGFLPGKNPRSPSRKIAPQFCGLVPG